ncbi:hypothetical protein Tco_1103387 [Tanacetum coccineum]
MPIISDIDLQDIINSLSMRITYYKKDEEEVSDDEEVTQVKVLMALADDELTVGKSHSRNGEWVDITIRKVNTLLFMDEDADWQNYLKELFLMLRVNAIGPFNPTLQREGDTSETDAVVIRDFYKKLYNSLGRVPNHCSSSYSKTSGLLSFSRGIGWEGLITI